MIEIKSKKMYRLLTVNGEILSIIPGLFGGHRKQRIYGRLDCQSALKAIAKGGYVTQRVFFATEIDAINVGYRPCARCLPE